MPNMSESNLREYWEAIRGIYEDQKKGNNLYLVDGTNAQAIIYFFYTLMPDAHFNLGMNSFKKKYINSETELEQNSYNQKHSKEERKGLAEMYNFIEKFDLEKNGKNYSIYILIKLHQLLYSKSKHPEVGGAFRNQPAYISNNPIEIYPWEYIQGAFNDKAKDYNEIMDLQINTSADIVNYMDKCIEFTTDLLRVHPFVDGNGRSIRGLQNLMFKKANLPPVYVEPNEKEAYLKAIHKAQALGDYSEIKGFYYYKVCDSLFELTKTKLSNKSMTDNKNNKQI